MGHCFHHALSSVRKWGGVTGDYQALHDWFDQSKMHFADFRHRALRHHTFGIAMLKRQVDDQITTSDGACVPVDAIAEQHLIEDLGCIPTVADWLMPMHIEPWMGRIQRRTPCQHAISSAEKWGGTPEEYLPLHHWFFEPEDEFPHLSSRAIRYHAAGVWGLQERFGQTITLSTGRVLPTRFVGERHVLDAIGWIPTVADWFRCIRPKAWMGRAQPIQIDGDPFSKARLIALAA